MKLFDRIPMLRHLAAVSCAAPILAACEEPPPDIIEHVRPIKTITVAERASGQTRKFSGVVEAVDTSSLSFEVAGNVQVLNVDVGDRIGKGEVVAVLDKKPFELRVDGAKADLGRANAELAKQRTEFDRQDTLYRKGWVAKAAQEQAQAAFDSAKNQVKFATSQLNLARRDLDKTELRAPFDSVISTRHVDAFEEVARGQAIFDIYAEGAMEVKVSIPETSINQIHLGLPAEVTFPTLADSKLTGRVSEIGTKAEQANAFPVKVALIDQPEKILPGMTAEANLILGGGDQEASYLVPLTAIAPGEAPQQGYVFVYDPASSTVARTLVRGGGVRDNQVVITEGVKGGDVIAVAGVSFLSDGQKVKLLQP